MRNRNWIGRSLQIVVLLLAVWVGGFIYYAETLPRTVSRDGSVADGIASLTGGPNRLSVALQLLEDGKGKRLLISGVHPKVGTQTLQTVLGLPDKLSEGERDWLECCIDLGRAALDTTGNAAEIAKWARSYDYTTVHVVTAAFHLPRSLVEIQHAAPELVLIPHPVFSDNFKIHQWWRYRRSINFLVLEFNKYVVSLFRTRFIDVDNSLVPS